MKYSNDWLFTALSGGRTFSYLYFWGHRPAADGAVTKSCFSQWYAAGFSYEGAYFPTAEHWMMWQKANTFSDTAIAARILQSSDPKQVKSLGRKVKNYVDEKWSAVKYQHVVKGNVLKFGQQPRLKAFLLATGDQILVEASPDDFQWGIGMVEAEAQRVDDPTQWRGTNLLGWALMEARDQLRQE